MAQRSGAGDALQCSPGVQCSAERTQRAARVPGGEFGLGAARPPVGPYIAAHAIFFRNLHCILIDQLHPRSSLHLPGGLCTRTSETRYTVLHKIFSAPDTRPTPSAPRDHLHPRHLAGSGSSRALPQMVCSSSSESPCLAHGSIHGPILLFLSARAMAFSSLRRSFCAVRRQASQQYTLRMFRLMNGVPHCSHVFQFSEAMASLLCLSRSTGAGYEEPPAARKYNGGFTGGNRHQTEQEGPYGLGCLTDRCPLPREGSGWQRQAPNRRKRRLSGKKYYSKCRNVSTKKPAQFSPDGFGFPQPYGAALLSIGLESSQGSIGSL